MVLRAAVEAGGPYRERIVGFTRLPLRRTPTRILDVGKRTLIVDDNPDFRAAAAELLAECGFELIDEAADGDEALSAVSRTCPDGILLDINLPGRDGFAVATSLASACPGVRIVLTSSEVDRVSATVLKNCGAMVFVPKDRLATVDLRELLAG
jgi:CheY-like chemotaxis protein